MKQIQGTTALIVGASGTVGAAVAVNLARSGHPVALVGRNIEKLEEVRNSVRSVGGTAVTVEADVSVEPGVSKACRFAEESLGPIRVLINAAGQSAEFGTISEADSEVWWDTIAVNLRAPALFASRLLPSMLEANIGRIVNIASSAAFWTDDGTASAYAVSKAGQMRLTRSLAAQTSGTGVLIFDVSPGMVRSSMTARLPGYSEIPADRFRSAEVGAALVSRLVDEDHPAMHGRFIHVDDDLSVLEDALEKDPRTRTLGLL